MIGFAFLEFLFFEGFDSADSKLTSLFFGGRPLRLTGRSGTLNDTLASISRFTSIDFEGKGIEAEVEEGVETTEPVDPEVGCCCTVGVLAASVPAPFFTVTKRV